MFFHHLTETSQLVSAVFCPFSWEMQIKLFWNLKSCLEGKGLAGCICVLICRCALTLVTWDGLPGAAVLGTRSCLRARLKAGSGPAPTFGDQYLRCLKCNCVWTWKRKGHGTVEAGRRPLHIVWRRTCDSRVCGEGLYCLSPTSKGGGDGNAFSRGVAAFWTCFNCSDRWC